MPPVDGTGPPDVRQLGLFFVAAAYFWIQGWLLHRKSRELNPAWRTPTPHWIRWLCGEFDAEYGVESYAVLSQVPQVIMSVLALIGYVVLPTAALYGWFLGIPFVIYCAIILYPKRKPN
jgi:hypothetical protein